MSSVTARIKEIKQPYGGYIKPSSMKTITIDDGKLLHDEENINAGIVGATIDYLTRFLNNSQHDTNPESALYNAFKISIMGAHSAVGMGQKDALDTATNLLKKISGADEGSIINACKLSTYDIWLRNPMGALLAKTDKETNPDKNTIENIQIMINRSLLFFKEYGPVIQDGFTFEPNGYTKTVTAGDGDFLTPDTLWDFKVSKSKPDSKQTLQLLMYWIMGQHSGQDIFKSIKKIGIFNPRLNTIYTYDISTVPEDIIKEIENDVICY